MAHRFIMNAGLGNIVKIECHETLPSTVELARSYARLGYPDKYIIFAKNQKSTRDGGNHSKKSDNDSMNPYSKNGSSSFALGTQTTFYLSFYLLLCKFKFNHTRVFIRKERNV